MSWQKKGIKTELLDLEKDVPKGEMDVIWGVLHHFDVLNLSLAFGQN